MSNSLFLTKFNSVEKETKANDNDRVWLLKVNSQVFVIRDTMKFFKVDIYQKKATNVDFKR